MKKNKLYIAIFLIILFIIDTIIVINNLTIDFDNTIHNFIHSNTSVFINNLMHSITFLGSTLFIVSLCLIIFIAFIIKGKKKRAFSIASILIVSTILNNVIKFIIRRPRPEYIEVIENTYSFPSGHMMASTTLYGFLIYLVINSQLAKKYKIIISTFLSLIILSVGVSRIYLGAHFASDIIGAFLLSLTLIIIFDSLKDTKKILD